MLRIANRCIVAVLMILMLAVSPMGGNPARAADAGKSATKKMRLRGRLPAHYAPVVTDQQKEKIYEIQAEYQIKIEPLEEQLKQLKQERDEKIAALLSPDQRKEIEEAKAASKRKSDAVEPGKKAAPKMP